MVFLFNSGPLSKHKIMLKTYLRRWSYRIVFSCLAAFVGGAANRYVELKYKKSPINFFRPVDAFSGKLASTEIFQPISFIDFCFLIMHEAVPLIVIIGLFLLISVILSFISRVVILMMGVYSCICIIIKQDLLLNLLHQITLDKLFVGVLIMTMLRGLGRKLIDYGSIGFITGACWTGGAKVIERLDKKINISGDHPKEEPAKPTPPANPPENSSPTNQASSNK